MTEESRIIKGYVSLPYQWSMGVTTTRFFEEIDSWVEVSQEGTLRTWCLINFAYEGQPKEPPYIIGIIDLDGADVGLPHFVGGVKLSDVEEIENSVHIGGRVKAVWRKKREGNILDIDYFKPVG
jgi:uncharacterized OB-fold protein